MKICLKYNKNIICQKSMNNNANKNNLFSKV